MNCPYCGRQARVFRVDESDPEGVRIYYICPNRQCTARGKQVGSALFCPGGKEEPPAAEAAP